MSGGHLCIAEAPTPTKKDKRNLELKWYRKSLHTMQRRGELSEMRFKTKKSPSLNSKRSGS